MKLFIFNQLIIKVIFSVLIILVSSSLVSFIGSIQLGPVNLYIINKVLFQSKRSAFWLALGGCIPEFIYCGIAVFATSFLNEFKMVVFLIKIVFIIFLILISIIFFAKKNINKQNELNTSKSDFNKNNVLFMKGFSLALLNPQLLPFWMFVLVYFNSIKILEVKTILQICAYIFGAGLGAFILLMVLIKFADTFKTKLLKIATNPYYYKILAFLFLIIAIQQFFTLINT